MIQGTALSSWLSNPRHEHTKTQPLIPQNLKLSQICSLSTLTYCPFWYLCVCFLKYLTSLSTIVLQAITVVRIINKFPPCYYRVNKGQTNRENWRSNNFPDLHSVLASKTDRKVSRHLPPFSSVPPKKLQDGNLLWSDHDRILPKSFTTLPTLDAIQCDSLTDLSNKRIWATQSCCAR